MDAGKICVSPFWNESISWNTKDPYFSECFKHLILVIGSCAVLWLVAPFEFIKICKYRGAPHGWTAISIAKIVCKVLLLIICVIELIKEVYAYVNNIKAGLDGLIAAVAFLVTIVLTVILTMMCKKRGLRSSIALPSFWMVSTITTVITIYDDIHDVDESSWVPWVSLVDDCATFVISLVQLILSNLSEKETSPYGRELMNFCPLDGTPFVSRLTFSWILGLLDKSTKKVLHLDDLIPLCTELRSMVVGGRISEILQRSDRESSFSPAQLQIVRPVSQPREDNSSNNHGRGRSLLTALLKISSLYLTIALILEIIYTILYYLPIYIMSRILNNTEEPEWHIYVYATALVVVLLLCTLIDSQRKYFGLVSAFKIKTAVINAVFEKALIMQNPHNAKRHLQDNAENIFQMVCLLMDVWGTPLRILLGLYLLWLLLGPASFLGIVTAALLIPITIVIGSSAGYFKAKALATKSEWLRMLSESLHDIRSLKLYVWENLVLRKIQTLRKSEISKLRITKFLRIFFKLFLICSTSLVSLAAFFVFVVMNESFDMKIIFLAYYTFWLLKSPFTNVLRLLAHFVQGLSSISEVQSFLNAKQVEIFSKFSPTNAGIKILVENATFTSDRQEDFLLKDISLHIDDGTCVAIVGESFSGKSSLLRALLGEMVKLEGTAYVKGEIAFVSDNSWIQNTTLEENILFGRRKINIFYNNAVEICDLQQDIEDLPHGEETQVGDKGYPLNDALKFKVDLARAVYQNADIYLIDDPFKHIDTSTAERIFEKVIGDKGVLKKRIRIIATSNVKFLSRVDLIILMKDGQILEQGSYSDLVNKRGYFEEYLKTGPTQKIFRKKTESISPEHKLSFENFKYHSDPWYSVTEMSFCPEIDSFMQNERIISPTYFLGKVWSYLKMNGYAFTFGAILMAILANCCEVASLTWLAYHVTENESEQKMHRDLYIYMALILSQVLLCLVCGLFISLGNTIAIGKFYDWLLKRIFKAPLSTFATSFVRRILQSFDKDLQYTDEEIPVGIYIWLLMAVKIPVLLVTLGVNCPFLCVSFIYLILFLYAIQRFFMVTWRQLHYLSTSTRCPLSNFLENTLQGISNIRTSKASVPFLSRFHYKLDAHQKCNFLFLLVSRWLSSSLEIIGSFFMLFVVTMVIYDKGQDSYITGLVLVLALQVPECLVSFVYFSSMLDIDLSCLERLLSFSDVNEETEWGKKLDILWLKAGFIKIRNLSTMYGEGLYPVLNNINIAIQPGEKVAIVGKEDSGISTLLDSLLRLRSISEGQIFIDNVDIYNVSPRELRSKLGIIPQDPLIINGTLKENLDPEQIYSDEKLQMVIQTLELGSKDLSYMISTDISVEEKYLIALARCLLKMPKIVVIVGSENVSRGTRHFQNSTVISFLNSQPLDTYDRIICISSGEVS